MTRSPDSDSQNSERFALRAEIQRRGQRAFEPRKIADVLSGLLSRRGYAQVMTASALESAWKEAAGEQLSAHSRPGAVKAGVLEVAVRNSAVLQELTFQKRLLLKRLAELAPDHKVKSLRFRVSSLE